MKFSEIKVIGPKIGARGKKPGRMIDADNDGKCQEEGGKWVPCPPGVGDGHVINAAGEAIRKITKLTPTQKLIKQRRDNAASKAEKIAERAAESVTREHRFYAKEIPDLTDQLRNATSSAEKRDIRNHIITNIKSIIEHEYTGNDGQKYRTKIDNITVSEDGINIEGTILNHKGTQIGDFNRTIDTDAEQVEHVRLVLNETSQGLGLASQFNARNEILYKEMGIKTIYAGALSSPSGYKGATHWPRNGYDWADMRSKIEFLSTIQAAIRKHLAENTNGKSQYFDSTEQALQLKELADRAASESLGRTDRLTAGDLLHWPGADKWFQKAYSTIDYRRPIN